MGLGGKWEEQVGVVKLEEENMHLASEVWQEDKWEGTETEDGELGGSRRSFWDCWYIEVRGFEVEGLKLWVWSFHASSPVACSCCGLVPCRRRNNPAGSGELQRRLSRRHQSLAAWEEGDNVSRVGSNRLRMS